MAILNKRFSVVFAHNHSDIYLRVKALYYPGDWPLQHGIALWFGPIGLTIWYK